MAPFENGGICGKKDKVYMKLWIRLTILKATTIFILILCLLGGSYYWYKQNTQYIAPAPLELNEAWKAFDFGGQKYPIIYEKQYITIEGEIKDLDFFTSPGKWSWDIEIVC